MMSGVSAFLWQAALMLLVAYFLGAFIGCWLRRWFSKPPKVAMEAVNATGTAAATAALATATPVETATAETAGPANQSTVSGAMGDAAARSVATTPSSDSQASAPAGTVAPAEQADTAEPAPPQPEPKRFTPPMSAAAAAAAALAARQAAKAAQQEAEAKAQETAPRSPGPTAAKMQTIDPPASVNTSDLPAASGSSGQAVVAARVAPSITTKDEPDDLTLIEGVSAEDAKKLNDAGVSTFASIAALSATDVSRLNDLIGGRRVSRENWIEQAQLLQSGTGTVFSTRTRPSIAPRPSLSSSMPVAATSPVTKAPAAVSTPVTQPNASAVAGKPEVSNRAAFSRERRGYADDLQQIDGINAEVEKLLNEQGVTRIAQIASWSHEEQKRIDRLLGGMDRVKRERWVDQARRICGFAAPAPVATRAPSAPPASAQPASAAAQSTGAPRQVPNASATAQPAPSPSADKSTSGSVARLTTASTASGNVRGLRSVRSEALVGPNTVNNNGVNDDLKYIRGIGVLIEKRLRAMGYTSYAQIASWTQSDVDRVNQQLDFRGRIERENWIEQARILAAGGQTDFSRRQDRAEDRGDE